VSEQSAEGAHSGMVAQALALEASVSSASLKVGASVRRSADLLRTPCPAACGKTSTALQIPKALRSLDSATSSRPSVRPPETQSVKARAMASVSVEKAPAQKKTGYGGLPLLTPEIAKLLPVAEEYTFAVLGDLHLEPAQMDLCDAGRELILKQVIF
jgi:hypothetical protein